MAGGAVNATKFLQRQGIDPKMVYEAVGVENKDKRKLCRIQARIKGIFDGIPDGDLPWAIANYNHPDGAYNKGSKDTCSRSDHSGMIFIPKIGHTVGITFPTGDTHKPFWSGYTVDTIVKMPEGDVNYPDRAVFKFSNGTYMIIDTKTNEIFLNNPGDMDITVLGDVNTNIIGNQTTTVSSRKGDIPGYLLNAPQTALSLLKQKPTKKIPYIGLLKKTYAGHQHTWVTGDQTTYIEGDRKTVIDGYDTLIVGRDRNTLVKGSRYTVIKGNDMLNVGINRIETIALLHRIQCTRSETNG
jgi:hypothetical protein